MADGTTNTSSQDIAIYNDVLFQAFADNKMKTFDISSGTQLGEFDITIDHGDSIEFAKEKENEYPLLYATSDTTPLNVYVNKVTNTSAQLIRTYTFPQENTGYYAGHCTDFDNNIMYTVGYTNNTYYKNDGTNNMIVCAWNLSTTITNDDGTITPTLLKTFKLPFMITVQGQKFHDDKLYLVSSHWENINTIIYIVDPLRERIVSRITDMKYKSYECEGIDFVDNYMIAYHRHKPYVRMEVES